MTVAALVGGRRFQVQSVATTLERTTFGRFREGQRVNLERALRFGDRLGGHLVQGHVDGVGEVVGVRAARRAGAHRLPPARPTSPAVTVLHGSITLNGISLTVNALPDADVAQVSIIPFTWEQTTICGLRVGRRGQRGGRT